MLEQEYPILIHKHYHWKRPCWECGRKTYDRYNVITPLHDRINLCSECASVYKTIDKS